MTTSGSTDFSVDRDKLITGALRLLGVVAQGESPNTTQITEASEALNMMVKAWEADGMPLWALKTTQVPLTAGAASYTIGLGQTVNTAKPLKIIQCWNRNSTSNVDIPVRIITKQEYNILGNKTTSGNPIQIYYEPQIDSGTLYTFPVADTSSESQNSLYIVYQRPFEDFDASTDTPDFPQEWYEAIKYGLAVRLAPEYGLDSESRKFLLQEYATVKATAMSFGTEEGSLYFQVERRGW